jgi:putative transcriptional regulator
MKITKLLPRLVFASLLAWCALSRAADLSEVILVAKPHFRDEFYGSTILVVREIAPDQHVGFIVNRPTRFSLAKMFPSHGPSQKVIDPVDLGGPLNSQAIFALVQRPDNPGGDSFEILPGLFAAFDGATVDRIIEREPEHARFVAGLVAWRSGELREELKRDFWYVLEPDAALVLRKPTEGLWEELVGRSERAANAI